MKRSGIYPGTFDPITNGHLDLIRRWRAVFDRVIVAVARNPQKGPLYAAKDRLAMAREAVGDDPGIEVVLFDELLIGFARKHGCVAILRGLRAVSDFEYELQIALTNRQMRPEIETIFLAPSINYIYLSSSIVKEIASYRGPVDALVPPGVAKRLRATFGARTAGRNPARKGTAR
jgi:pantetheine-phosphate adenylyltransferase